MSTYLQDPVAHPEQEAELTDMFRAWTNGQTALLQLMAGSPLLAEALPRAQQLPELGATGLEAVAFLSSGTPAPAGWKAQKLAALDEAGKPVAMVQFTVLKPLRDLVNEVR